MSSLVSKHGCHFRCDKPSLSPPQAGHYAILTSPPLSYIAQYHNYSIQLRIYTYCITPLHPSPALLWPYPSPLPVYTPPNSPLLHHSPCTFIGITLYTTPPHPNHNPWTSSRPTPRHSAQVTTACFRPRWPHPLRKKMKGKKGEREKFMWSQPLALQRLHAGHPVTCQNKRHPNTSWQRHTGHLWGTGDKSYLSSGDKAVNSFSPSAGTNHTSSVWTFSYPSEQTFLGDMLQAGIIIGYLFDRRENRFQISRTVNEFLHLKKILAQY